jgi:hypothetical protein
MNRGQWKGAVIAAAGALTGIAVLLLFRSIPIAAGTATGVIVAILVLKHLALIIMVGLPLTAFLQKIRPKIRSHCPFAKH